MTRARTSSRALGWATLLLLAAAVAAFVVPVALFAFASADDGVAVGGGPVRVEAPPGRTWGVYFDDADNSGYSESCSIHDRSGQVVEIRDPGPSVSASDTETLDHVFTTPADGAFTIACDASGATVRVAPVGNLLSVGIGVVVAVVLGVLGLVVGIIWLARRTSSTVVDDNGQ